VAPAVAAQVQLPAPHLALFGWGDKAEGKVEQLVGKAQVKTGNKLEGTAKQISGRAKYDLVRVEEAAQRTADKTDKMAKDMKKGTEKNLNKAGDSIKDTANNMVDGVKKMIDN
jgi:cytochrome c556